MTINGGLLRFQDMDDTWITGLALGSAGTMEIEASAQTFQFKGTATISGSGTLVKKGSQNAYIGNNGHGITMAMSGGLIDVQQGLLRNEYGTFNDWTANKSGLRVASGATFDLWDSTSHTYVDTLTGSGTITRGHGTGTINLTIGTGNGSGTFDGNIGNNSGSIKLIKTGTGTQTLTGANTYSGATAINSGTLLMNGTHTGGGAYTVNNGGTLGGIGSISAAVSAASGGTVQGGTNSLTELTINGNLSMTAGVTGQFFLGGADSSKLAVNGTVALNNTTLNVSVNSTPVYGTTFFIIENDGSDDVVGTFNSLAEGDLYSVSYGGTTYGFKVHYKANSATGERTGGNDVALRLRYYSSAFLFK